jgi:glycosyltransferase involved in cell wall biosynthesis
VIWRGMFQDYEADADFNTMKFSVITAVYNNREHIAESIDSVLAQSHPDVELIVIDGGSTDGTLETLQGCGVPFVR